MSVLIFYILVGVLDKILVLMFVLSVNVLLKIEYIENRVILVF